MTRVMPNGFSGPSAMVSTTVEQLGLVTIWPFQPRLRCWPGMSFKWSGLTSGTSRGTSGSMRWFLEFETTTWPACAKARSISVATEASIAEKSRRGALPTDVWWHTIVSPTGKEKTGYATQKPLGILERIVRVHSNPGELVLDFFAGSGTTGEAAAQNGRAFCMVDESAEAVAVMEKRLRLKAEKR